MTLGNCLFYPSRTQKFEDETSKSIKHKRKKKQLRKQYLKGNATNAKTNTRNRGTLIQTGTQKPQSGEKEGCKKEARKMEPQNGGGGTYHGEWGFLKMPQTATCIYIVDIHK